MSKPLPTNQVDDILIQHFKSIHCSTTPQPILKNPLEFRGVNIEIIFLLLNTFFSILTFFIIIGLLIALAANGRRTGEDKESKSDSGRSNGRRRRKRRIQRIRGRRIFRRRGGESGNEREPETIIDVPEPSPAEEQPSTSSQWSNSQATTASPSETLTPEEEPIYANLRRETRYD